MFYRIGDFLLNLNRNSFRIYQQSSSAQAHLYASDIGSGTAIVSGTREEVEATLADIQEALRVGKFLTLPEPEEVVGEADDADESEEVSEEDGVEGNDGDAGDVSE